MLFNSNPFVVFAVAFFSLYYLLPHRGQLIWTLLASYFFYAWWDARFAILLAGNSLVNYGLGIAISRAADERQRRLLLTTAITGNLAVLGFFKYFNFFAASALSLARDFGFSASDWTLNIVLPIGISFYTFHSINYVMDVYRRKTPAETDPIKFLVYLALWPQLVAGPIVRARRLLPQLRERKRFSWPDMVLGMKMVIVGFIMKSVVADNLSPTVDAIFGAPEAYGAAVTIIGIVFFAFQIYGDFAGYSLIAIGFGRIMGLNLSRNFNRPYFSKDFSEFWQRWHISLSSWLRDYLYIALGGNRKGVFNTYRNLLLTMVLGGLWHGANWTFIIWGTLHGSYLVVQRLLEGRVRGPKEAGGLSRCSYIILNQLFVFFWVCVAWVYFRASSFENANQIFSRIANGSWSLKGFPSQTEAALGMVLVMGVFAVEAVKEHTDLYRRIWKIRGLIPFLFAGGILLIALLGRFDGGAFIYFQF